MERDESISERLLSRLPRPANLAAYQEEVTSLLAENDKRLRRNKRTVAIMWIFVVAIAVPFLGMAGTHFNTSQGNWFLGITCVWVLLGAVEVAKYASEQGRVELLKELKQIQLQVLELQATLARGGPIAEKR